MVGFHGVEFNNEIKDLIDELQPGGVILFKRNIVSPYQVSRLNHDLQDYSRSRFGRGIFIGVDQEGGRVRRLARPFSEFGSPRSMAQSSDPSAAVEHFAKITAKELRITGFNVDFVPVMDLVDDDALLETTVIGDRSYGPDPCLVAQLGRLLIETMRAHGVIPCSKHFPGHGGTLVDSHYETPVDHRPWETLESKDLYPFKKAIESDVEMIMTAHALYPAIDPDRPATVSSEALDGILRKRLGFRGVVVTDDLDMGAISKRFEADQAGLMALQAGADLLLICNEPQKVLLVRKKLLEAMEKGDIQETRIWESLERLDRLSEKYQDSMKPCSPEEVKKWLEPAPAQ
jgi:beta-N-acetylhexosaminidase